jgi:hypothetical protein
MGVEDDGRSIEEVKWKGMQKQGNDDRPPSSIRVLPFTYLHARTSPMYIGTFLYSTRLTSHLIPFPGMQAHHLPKVTVLLYSTWMESLGIYVVSASSSSWLAIHLGSKAPAKARAKKNWEQARLALSLMCVARAKQTSAFRSRS